MILFKYGDIMKNKGIFFIIVVSCIIFGIFIYLILGNEKYNFDIVDNGTTLKANIIFYNEKNIESGLGQVNLSGSVKTPSKQTKGLSLPNNSKYVISFDFITTGSTNKFNVDLCSGSINKTLTASTKAKHYDWIVTNNSGKNCELRFIDNIQETNENDIQITNITINKPIQIMKKSIGDKIESIPKASKSGYNFVGWYTSVSGGKKVTKNTIVSDTSTLKLYPRFSKVDIGSINLNRNSIKINVGDVATLSLIITPQNASNTKVTWTSSNPEVATVTQSGKVNAISAGTTTITVKSYNNKTTSCVVTITKKDNPIVVTSSQNESVNYSSNEEKLDFIAAKQAQGSVKYKIISQVNSENKNVNIFSIKKSSKPIINVLSKAPVGKYTVTIRATAAGNDMYKSGYKDIKITVTIAKIEIEVDNHPKTIIKVGESTTVRAHLSNNVSGKIVYKSSNNDIATVENGVIIGKKQGNVQITLSYGNSKTKTYSIKVLPSKGAITGSGGIWGYTSLNAKTPVPADINFYKKLVQNGIGVIKNNQYIISSSGVQFSYNISTEILSVSNKRIRLRLYYPSGVDLSTTNTLVFMGGRGETNFGGLFREIKDNPSIVKNGGILALIAEGNTSFDGASGAYVTKFIKAITKQKTGVKNSILGFSDGAHNVMDGLRLENYDRIVVFSGYADYINTLENAKNSEIMIIIAPNDSNYLQAKSTINNMRNYGFKNATIISNGTELPNAYGSTYLVITPGNIMKNGHFTENILLSRIIEYLND